VIVDCLAAVVADALAETVALFGGHAAEVSSHAGAESEASAAMPPESAEEDAAEREEAEGLPEGEFVPAEERRH